MLVKNFFKLSFLFIILLTIESNAESNIQIKPKANAGDNKFALIDTIVSLNASNSTDVNGDKLNYKWEIISKPNQSQSILDDEFSITPKIQIDKEGVYQIKLFVTDGQGESTSVVEINTDNTKPIISNLPKQKVLLGESVSLSTEKTYDPDGDELFFNWKLLSKPNDSQAKISDSLSQQASIKTDQIGIYLIKLSVDDGVSEIQSTTTPIYALENIHIFNRSIGCVLDLIFYGGFENEPANSKPIADVGDDKLGFLGQSLSLDGSASYDIDLDDLTYQWSLLSAPANSMSVIDNPENEIASLNPDLVGNYVAQLMVNDGCLDSDPDSALVTITVNQPPSINSTAQTNAIEAHNYSYQVSATDPENHDLDYSLTTAPSGMQIDASGLITWTALTPANYDVTITVADPFGGLTTQNFTIIVTENNAPKIQSWPIKSGEKDFSYSYQLSVTEADGDVLNYTLITPPTNMSIDAQGLVSWTPDATGVFSIEIQVDDGFNATDTQIFDLEIIELPPNPNDIATPISKTEYTPFTGSIEFLYLNDPPVQVGMLTDTIQEYRSAVITGKVLDEDNNPIRGIKVTINNHPEYGHTYTSDNGIFFMVVNGGGTYTVNLSKGGYLPVQRDIKTPWNEYAYVEDLIIVRFDNKVTSIDLTDNSQPYQVARGNVVTDIDGTRQATMLFPAGITASMTMPNGSTQDISQLDVRATEYTVGENGPKRMPADLPAGSAYTYAVELSVDQAINNNATRVDFSEEVIFYLDDFIGFPQGVAVPSGWYDKEQAYWVPSDNGVVIKIIDIVNDQAVIDITVDEVDNAATQQLLDEIGIDNNELLKLAQIYSVGDLLWRTPIQHFTPFDLNFPYVPPKDIEEPPEQPDPNDRIVDENDDNDDTCSGCEIVAQESVLEETIPIIGTGLKLKYSSNGSKPLLSKTIKLTGATIPSSLEKIRVTLFTRNAGLLGSYEYDPSPNLTQEINWDGKDNFGRFVHTSNINYEIRYTYPAIYSSQPVRSAWKRIFAQIQKLGVYIDYGSRNSSKIFTYSSFTEKLNRNYSILEFDPENGNDSQPYLHGIKEEQLKLGGWGIENHHVYDPFRETLYQGDGFIRKVAAQGGYLGQIPFGYGHADPATASSAGTPTNIASAPNGDVYYSGIFADNLGHNFLMIRKVTPDGTVFTVASTSNDIFCETVENQNAMALCLNDIKALAVNDAGEVFYSNYDDYNMIRKIDRNGIVTTVAGSDATEFEDNIPAINAKINLINHMEFDKHGNLFILSERILRKIDTNGIISTVAANGGFGNTDNGILAIDANFDSASGFALSDDGSIYIADTYHYCIRQVTTDGYIYKYFDSPECSSGERRGDIPPGGSFDSPMQLELDDDGNLITLYNEYEGYFKKSYKFGMSEILNQNVDGFSGDGGSFIDAQFSYINDFIYSDKLGYHIADSGNYRMRRVTPSDYTYTFAGDGEYNFNEGSRAVLQTDFLKKQSEEYSRGEFDDFIFIPSRDGSLIHKFYAGGKHIKSIDALTGKELVRFIYSNGSGVLSEVIDENGLSTIINRDENNKALSIVSPYGKTTSFEYHEDGRLKKVIDPNTNNWTMGYAEGLLTSFTDRGDNNYIYTYQNGLLETDLNPIGGGWLLSSAYDESTKKNNTQLTSGEGRIYQFDETKLDDKTILFNTSPDGTTITKEISPFQSTFTYPDGTVMTTQSIGTARLGNQVRFNQNVQTTTPSGKLKVITNSLTESVVEEGSLAPVSSSVRTTTINDQVWQSEYSQLLGTNSGFMSTTPEGRTQQTLLNSAMDIKSAQTTGFLPTEFAYDTNRRVESISIGTGVDKRETILTYYDSGTMNGELHTITNAIGQTASFEYDNNGRVTKQIMPDLREIIYTYDANGNLKSLTPPGRPTHDFDYNGMDQETQYTPPDLVSIPVEQTVYTYNLDKQVTKITRPDGQEVDLSYNATSGKLETKTTPTGIYSYEYDATTGKLDQITSPAGITLDYTYDGFLPLTTTWSGNQTGSVARTYDNLFRVTSRTVNGTDTISYGYDNDNLLTSAGSLVISREAQKSGLINGTTLGSVTTTNSYSDFAELASYNAQYNAADIYDVTYTRDKLGRIKTKSETINAITTVYEYDYDLAGRLVEEKTNSVVTNTWDYDLNGNRTHINGVLVATYDDQDRLLTNGGNVYTYTDNGELLTKTNGADVTTYNYDVLGNLLSVTQPDGTLIEYLIDPRGRRVGKKVNGTLIKGWLYKDKLNPIAELDAAGNIVSRFIYGDRSNVPSYIVKNGVTYRIITNQLGSPLIIIDTSSGTFVQEMSYDTWGNVISDTNPEFQPFGFAGGIYDSDTLLTRFGFRDYAPKTGHWTVKDPIRFVGGLTSLYNYVGQDPINWIDISGAAKVCTRSLKGLNFSTNGNSDLSINHTHIFYDDGTHVGYNPTGIFTTGEDISEYTCGSKEYDDFDVKVAVEEVRHMEDGFLQKGLEYDADNYNVVTNNCQDFVTDVLKVVANNQENNE